MVHKAQHGGNYSAMDPSIKAVDEWTSLYGQ